MHVLQRIVLQVSYIGWMLSIPPHFLSLRALSFCHVALVYAFQAGLVPMSARCAVFVTIASSFQL